MAVPDAELVARVRQGDVEAFGPLAQRYERTLLAAALAQMRDIHAAEDVVQGALLCAFQRLSTLRDMSKFGPWLMQIARRQMVDAVRAALPRDLSPALLVGQGESAMNENRSLDDQLEAAGMALRGRPTIADRVMVAVREAAASSSTEEPVRAKRPVRLWRRRFTAAAVATVAVLATAVGILLMLTPAPSVGWAQMVEALQSQPWIRGRVTFSDGDHGTMWLSPQQRIWAYRLGGSCRFYDGRARVKYEHRGRNRPILKLPLGEEEAQRVLPVEALSRDESALGPWMFGEKIIQQERHEVTEAGKKWIDFKLTLWRGDANQATLRVDPENRLPVYLLAESPTGDVPPIKWEFDYPDDGPTDIYAMGVPRETEIDDQMPDDDVVAALDTIAASRALLGDFRLTVGLQADYRSFIVSRKGNRWRIDVCNGPYSLGRDDGKEKTDLSVDDWLAERLEQSEPRPLYICDGTTVLRNENSSRHDPEPPRWSPHRHIAPQDLLTPSTSFDDGLSGAPYVCLTKMVYPDLTPVHGWGFEFVRQPTDASNCVLIQRSAHTSMGNHAHEWFYLDPAKEYAVVRIELFTVPMGAAADPDSTSNRNTYRLEKFLQSPQGFWYPTEVHCAMSDRKHTIRYRYEFDVDLPDSLFEVAEAESADE
jgi:DNA-directed RNA polymerase specialized sigma24 family protein